MKTAKNLLPLVLMAPLAATAFAPPRRKNAVSLIRGQAEPKAIVASFQPIDDRRASTQLAATNEKGSSVPSVNIGLLRQLVFSQVFVGSTILFPGGMGAQVLNRNAEFSSDSLLIAAIGLLPLLFLSRQIETSESPAVADLNLSTNLLVLRLFGNRPQPLTAFAVSALIAGLTGLVEETTFRGELLPGLAQWASENNFEILSSGIPAGAVLSTVIFAALHVNPLGLIRGGKEDAADALVLFVYQLMTGTQFALLFLLTGNLAVPIITHALYDFYTFYKTHLEVTTQMEYARNEALMPTAARGVEAKWRRQRGDAFLRECKESFYLADSNRDGVLSRQELRIALYSYGLRLSAEQSATVLGRADSDRSGAIDFGEFLEFVGPTGSAGKAIKNSLLGVNG